MGILKNHGDILAQIVAVDMTDIDTVDGDGATLNIVEPVQKLVIVVLPAPVEPTKAIFCPGFA